MKRMVAVLIICGLVPTQALAQGIEARITPRPSLLANMALPPLQANPACDSSTSQGRTDASAQHGALRWFLGGVGLGVGLSLIGTGIIVAASALTNPQPDAVATGTDEACYREGYRGRAKNKNMVHGLLGGLVGTGAFLAILVAASGG